MGLESTLGAMDQWPVAQTRGDAFKDDLSNSPSSQNSLKERAKECKIPKNTSPILMPIRAIME
jgi:hypothetical protein